MNFIERLYYYLGENFYNKDEKKKLKNNTKLILDKSSGVFNNYDKNLHNLLSKTGNLDKPFIWYRGDNVNMDNTIALLKNRIAFNKNGVILRCLNYNRHWNHYYNKPIDIPFCKKKNTIFWRGVTTGNENDIGNRFSLINKWYDKDKNIDIGFSKIVQNKHKYKDNVKGNENIKTFLKYKYLLSVRGNDKDSGLQWKLNSNSVVLMTRPSITSWLMESTLIPDFHYVLLKDDFSDLKEKLDWCNNNQDKCKDIVMNANLFMKQFSDSKLEEQLEIAVINKYFKLLE